MRTSFRTKFTKLLAFDEKYFSNVNLRVVGTTQTSKLLENLFGLQFNKHLASMKYGTTCLVGNCNQTGLGFGVPMVLWSVVTVWLWAEIQLLKMMNEQYSKHQLDKFIYDWTGIRTHPKDLLKLVSSFLPVEIAE